MKAAPYASAVAQTAQGPILWKPRVINQPIAPITTKAPKKYATFKPVKRARARHRLERAAQQIGGCLMQPVGAASWTDAVRCIVEPLAVFGLIGVDPREIHGLLRTRLALLHLWDDASLDSSLQDARDVLVSCRLRPSATLREVDAAATRVRTATAARLVLAGPEVPRDEGPDAIAAVFL